MYVCAVLIQPVIGCHNPVTYHYHNYHYFVCYICSSAVDYLERLVSEMNYYVSSGTLGY